MASPQKENGFTQIANEILEALMMADLTKREYKVVLCALRVGYGYNLKGSTIKLSPASIARSTGMYRQDMGKTLKSLQEKSIISIDNATKTIQFNKDYDVWKLLTPIDLSVSKALHEKLVKYELLPEKRKQSASNDVSSLLVWARDNLLSLNQLELPKYSLNKSYIKEIFKEKDALLKEIIVSLSKTRKGNVISDSILAKEFSYWSNYPAHVVIEAIRFYLEKKFYLENRNEKYLRGIIRGYNKRTDLVPTPSAEPRKHGEGKYAHLYIR